MGLQQSRKGKWAIAWFWGKLKICLWLDGKIFEVSLNNEVLLYRDVFLH